MHQQWGRCIGSSERAEVVVAEIVSVSIIGNIDITALIVDKGGAVVIAVNKQCNQYQYSQYWFHWLQCGFISQEDDAALATAVIGAITARAAIPVKKG